MLDPAFDSVTPPEPLREQASSLVKRSRNQQR